MTEYQRLIHESNPKFMKDIPNDKQRLGYLLFLKCL